MKYSIKQSDYAPELKDMLMQKLINHGISTNGINFWELEPIILEVREEDELIAGVMLDFCYKQLHISKLFVDETYRGQGIGTALIQRAMEYGIWSIYRSYICFSRNIQFSSCGFVPEIGF